MRDFGQMLGNQVSIIPTNKYRLQLLCQGKNCAQQLIKDLFQASRLSLTLQLNCKIQIFSFQRIRSAEPFYIALLTESRVGRKADSTIVKIMFLIFLSVTIKLLQMQVLK